MTDIELDSDLNKIVKSDFDQDTNNINDDDFLNELENDEIPKHIREARLNELKMKALQYQTIQANRNELYKELNEEEFLNFTTKSKKCIVHFFHNDFRRCDIMHTHLQKLAHKYSDYNFAKINVEKAKFFVKKLNIQVLPAVLCFVEGVLKNRIIGFDQLGNSDNFDTLVLEKHLIKLGFLKCLDGEEDSENEDDFKTRKNIISTKKNNYDSDSD